MDCLTRYPWGTAAVATVVLAAAFGVAMQRWAAKEKAPRSLAGFWLGICESVIFMAAFSGGGAAGGAAWLAFKVASKWKSWELIASDAAKRERAVTYGYRAFLLGTAGNIVIGLIGAFIAIELLGAQPFLRHAL